MKPDNSGGSISIHHEESDFQRGPYSKEDKAKLGFDPDRRGLGDLIINLPSYFSVFIRILAVIGSLIGIVVLGVAFGPLWAVVIMLWLIGVILFFK